MGSKTRPDGNAQKLADITAMRFAVPVTLAYARVLGTRGDDSRTACPPEARA
jgi:hypothetical protein